MAFSVKEKTRKITSTCPKSLSSYQLYIYVHAEYNSLYAKNFLQQIQEPVKHLPFYNMNNPLAYIMYACITDSHHITNFIFCSCLVQCLTPYTKETLTLKYIQPMLCSRKFEQRQQDKKKRKNLQSTWIRGLNVQGA